VVFAPVAPAVLAGIASALGRSAAHDEPAHAAAPAPGTDTT
jgi:hypothetical protein